MEKKKIVIHSETAYFAACILLSLAVAMISTTPFGLSMVVAPAYVISEYFGITFGQGEYIVQAVLFIVLCIVLKKFKAVYFQSFITGLIYGTILDFWRIVIPHFNPDITEVGSLPLYLQIIYFVSGVILTSFSVALFFKVYLYPQVYDFFVKAVSSHNNIKLTVFKTCFDCSCLVVAVVLSLLFFNKFVGVGFGTVLMAIFNGYIIGLFGKFFDKYFEFKPLFTAFSAKFIIE